MQELEQPFKDDYIAIQSVPMRSNLLPQKMIVFRLRMLGPT